ncbi:hypothetical protein T11_2872 [Trichinella zimbabwensis]|uniref:Uncharacterized protein n=1 Tax=Trichinella zimbabwensis TaxID=268475 RepID=A0A0V1GAV9_9BILA|nr:hypothetical protein T11_2872 [Trichinella zimbabwensis]
MRKTEQRNVAIIIVRFDSKKQSRAVLKDDLVWNT